jgi:hypothetical protein
MLLYVDIRSAYFCHFNSLVSSSVIVDHVKHAILRNDEDSAMAYVYCDYQSRAMRSPLDVLRLFIKQILAFCEDIPDIVKDCYNSHQLGRVRLTLADSLDLLLKLSRQFSKIYLCIDALDEFASVDSDQMRVMQATIQDLFEQWRGPENSLRVLVTSRLNQRHDRQNFQKIQVIPKCEDISRFVRATLCNPSTVSLWEDPNLAIQIQCNKALAEEMVQQCTKQAGDM